MNFLKHGVAQDSLIWLGAGVTGKTLTITASKNGGAFASITPTVTEVGNGFYKLAFTASHLDTVGEFWLRITAASVDTAVKYYVGPDVDTNEAVATVQATIDDALIQAHATTYVINASTSRPIPNRPDSEVIEIIKGNAYDDVLTINPKLSFVCVSSQNLVSVGTANCVITTITAKGGFSAGQTVLTLPGAIAAVSGEVDTYLVTFPFTTANTNSLPEQDPAESVLRSGLKFDAAVIVSSQRYTGRLGYIDVLKAT